MLAEQPRELQTAARQRGEAVTVLARRPVANTHSKQGHTVEGGRYSRLSCPRASSACCPKPLPPRLHNFLPPESTAGQMTEGAGTT